MSETSQSRSNEAKWPGIEQAYAFVLPSYHWMLTRYEAADSRLQALLTVVATVNLAAPTVLAAVCKDGLRQSPLLLVGALTVGVLAVVVGVVARTTGAGVMLASPEVLWRKWTRLDEWTFKARMLDYSARHFEDNRRAVERKGRLATLMVVLFLFELALLAAWLYVTVAATGCGQPAAGGHP
jgi:hypothetical protein